jgi:hypothetical protein
MDLSIPGEESSVDEQNKALDTRRILVNSNHVKMTGTHSGVNSSDKKFDETSGLLISLSSQAKIDL